MNHFPVEITFEGVKYNFQIARLGPSLLELAIGGQKRRPRRVGDSERLASPAAHVSPFFDGLRRHPLGQFKLVGFLSVGQCKFEAVWHHSRI